MKKFILSLLIFAVNCLVAQKNNNGFYFIAFGDMPYFLPKDYSKFENVIKEINKENPVFTVNVGDFKSSSTPCSDEAYLKMYNYYNQFSNPLIYVPGDNEWTDCFKKEAGSYNSEERLEALRKLFFKNENSLGKVTLKLNSQSSNPAFKKFVENNRWDFGEIAFATVHIVGTNNNFVTISNNGNTEYFERDSANITWLDEIFRDAKESNKSAIVLVTHADMFSESNNMKYASGFYNIKKRLKELVIDFKKPVLLIHGDSHQFLIDKPLYKDENKLETINNFTRLQVHGEYNMNAVKIFVNYKSSAIFQFEELIFDSN
jgi:hypothetical protein